MSSYRSAYENYYKNINNAEKTKKDKSKQQFCGQKKRISTKSLNNINNSTIEKILIKRIISELTGSVILILFFVVLKYVPSSGIKEMHIKCKQALSYNFNYDGCIDRFNKVKIGNIEVKDMKIGDFTTEDLKTESLKAKASNFIEYFKNNNVQD